MLVYTFLVQNFLPRVCALPDGGGVFIAEGQEVKEVPHLQ